MVSIRLRSVGPEKCSPSRPPSPSTRFQSVSGLWDRRNRTRRQTARRHPAFQSVSGLWDRRNLERLAGLTGSNRFQSVSGLWDRRNRRSAAWAGVITEFQSVSGLWDRRNFGWYDRSYHGTGFNPSPVCGTGEIRFVPRSDRRRLVSIRLRSVGPEKFPGPGDDRREHLVSIRLRSVGPEKSSSVSSRTRTTSFQSVSGLWDRRNRRRWPPWPPWPSFNPSPVCGTGEIAGDHEQLFGGSVSIRLRSVGPEKS